jgi:hypothetical protein
MMRMARRSLDVLAPASCMVASSGSAVLLCAHETVPMAALALTGSSMYWQVRDKDMWSSIAYRDASGFADDKSC